MSEGALASLRRSYHAAVFERVLRVNPDGIPNNADKGSKGSVRISQGIVREIDLGSTPDGIAGQTAGKQFEEVTRDFLQTAFLGIVPFSVELRMAARVC